MKSSLGQSAILVTMVVVRAFTMLAAFKFLSNHFGAYGFGILSQIMAVGALFSTFSGGGLTNGLIKEIAGASTQIEKSNWFQAGLTISIASALLLALVSIGLFLWGSDAVLGDSKLAWIFLLIGVAQGFTGIGSTAQAYLSGIKDIRSVATAGICGVVLSALLIVSLSFVFGFEGAAVGCALIALSPALFALALLALKQSIRPSSLFIFEFDKARLIQLMHYSLAMLATASVVPLVLIYVRLRLSQISGWEVVGHWQAVSRIGDAYIQVFGALFISLILPRLANLNSKESFVATLGFIMPVMGLFICGAIVFWTYSPLILSLAYSQSFRSSSVFVFPQLLADFFKILSSFFIYRFVALGRPYMQALGEVVQASFMLLAFSLLLPSLGGLAAVWSYGAGTIAVLIYALVATGIDGSYRQAA